jgi:hypothetical protein
VAGSFGTLENLLHQGITSELKDPVVGWNGKSATLGASTTIPVLDCSGNDLKTFACYENYYKSLVAEKGVAAALADIKARYTENHYVQVNCHPLTHVIGQAVSALYPDISQAYLHGDTFCSSGYYHGVLEGVAFKIGKEKLLATLNTLCVDVPGSGDYSTEYYSCVHGLGHGIMEMNNDQLFNSLHDCDRFSRLWERDSCYGGVFMENIIVNDIHLEGIEQEQSTTFLRPNEPLYPCTAVGEEYQAACFLIQPSYALDRTNDFAKVFDLCAKEAGSFSGLCYQSLGRDAAGRALNDPVITKNTCTIGKNFEQISNCVVGAVHEYLYEFSSNVQARQFCAAQDTQDLIDLCNKAANATL